jgi:hypothetical protein
MEDPENFHLEITDMHVGKHHCEVASCKTWGRGLWPPMDFSARILVMYFKKPVSEEYVLRYGIIDNANPK